MKARIISSVAIRYPAPWARNILAPPSTKLQSVKDKYVLKFGRSKKRTISV